MNSLTNTGRTVTTTSKGCAKGKAKVTSKDAAGIETSCMVTVKEAREHMARLYAAGWR